MIIIIIIIIITIRFIRFLHVNNKDIFYAILFKEEHIGNIVVYIDSFNMTANLTILIGEKKYWGKGYGLIAFNYKTLKKLNLNKIKNNYFFEQDIIMNVTKLNCRIKQFKNEVIYSNESSKLNPVMSIIPFLYYHLINFIKNHLKI
jgi:hypothetical protein